MKTVLVVGAAGLVAAPLISQLLPNYRVKATVKSLKEKHKSNHLPKSIELLEANLLERPNWLPILDGVNYVIHTAAPFVRQTKKEEAALLDVLLEDTVNFVEACSSQKIQKLVYISSCSTVYGGRLDKKKSFFDESGVALEAKCNPFIKRRIAIERLLIQKCQQKGVPFTVLLPGIICGPIPSDRVHDFPSAMMISRLFSQNLPVLLNMTIPMVDSRDVAKACVSCIERIDQEELNGKRIIICEGTHSTDLLKTIIKRDYKSFKIKFPFFSMPKTIVGAATKDNPLVQTLLELVDRELVLDNSKSVKLLRMTYRPIEESVRDEINDLLGKRLIGKQIEPKPKL